MLEIYAGKTALKTIQEQGFSQNLFTSFLGASGGPKWFCLYELDRYLFGEFFKSRTSELNLVGSSAGAFRAACFAQSNPVQAIERFAKLYSQTVYSQKADRKEITDNAKQLLSAMMGETGIEQAINNSVFKPHFIVAKANGLARFENRVLQGIGMVKSFALNKVSRSKLNRQYQRFIFHSPSSHLSLRDPAGFKTTHIVLNQNNFMPALLASGAIPMVMQGIANIPNAPKGMYRDGGIIDYHFDFAIQGEGLTLYPHFNPNPKAGWFDKNSKRRVGVENYDKTVLICPSEQFIASLPFGKIPDRTDFTKLDDAIRLKYWQTVLDKTKNLAEQLDKDFNNTNILDIIKPFPF